MKTKRRAGMDNEKDFLTEGVEIFKQYSPIVTTLLLSSWGGLVNYTANIRKNKQPFNWRELAFDLITSSFAGLLTYYLCEWAAFDQMVSAILIAISGHMGTRAIASFETMYSRIVGGRTDG